MITAIARNEGAFLDNWIAGVPDRVDGRASVIDGDSLEIAGARIRLVGIDAPEAPQTCQRDGRDWPCGREAARRLRRLIGNQRVRCDVEKRDQHGRFLSVCRAGSVEINRWMVSNGWAVDYGRYGPQERQARRERRGLWRGEFEQPRDWRDRNRRSDATG